MEFLNQNMIRHLGYYAVGEKCYRVIYGRDGVCPWCTHARVIHGETVHSSFTNPRDNRPYHAIDTPIYNPDGTVSKLTMMQITGR